MQRSQYAVKDEKRRSMGEIKERKKNGGLAPCAASGVEKHKKKIVNEHVERGGHAC